MNEMILDCDLMRHPNSGLYHYCLNLGNYVQRACKRRGLKGIGYYVPSSAECVFDKRSNCIVERSYHKIIKPFLWGCGLWHAPFQSGRIIPDKTRNKNTKVLLTVHDLNSVHEGKSAEEQRRSLLYTQQLIDRSDAIVCISEFTRADVLKYCDVKNKAVWVVHNGTNRIESPVLSSVSYKPIRPFLFGMGYVNRKKNYHVLLPLAKAMDMELVIAGRLDEPDYVETIKVEAKRMGISERVCLPGPVTEEEKSWYLNNCTAFVHPSLAEGFGFPVVEAMQLGKPLFLSDKTSLPEIGGNIAFYFSSFEADYMNKVFREGMQRYVNEDMANEVRKRGKIFDWEIAAENYLAIYQTLL